MRFFSAEKVVSMFDVKCLLQKFLQKLDRKVRCSDDRLTKVCRVKKANNTTTAMSKIRDNTIINKSIVIAVDFGTSRTGYAFGFPGKPNIESNKEKYWDDAPESYCKTLTKIAYNEDDEPEYWGFTAWKEMLNDDDEDRVLHMFEFFKMGLFTHDHMVKDTTGTVEKNAVDVVIDYLKFLYAKIKDDLASRVRKAFSPAEIIWCLTIPAIWGDAEKSLMRQAAYRAGMIEVEHPPEDEFMLVLEPEAAAVYCMMQLQRQGTPLREGEKFVIVDAGGGTVDLTAHEYHGGKLKEITAGTGDACGSSKLDKQFEQLLYEVFGKAVMDEMRQRHPLQHFELLNNWEIAKCKTKTLDEKIKVRAPGMLNSILMKKGIRYPSFDSDLGAITLSPGMLKKIYMSTIEEVCRLISGQIEACKKGTDSTFDYIFIVGGFGGSVVLQDTIKSRFKNAICKSVVVPPIPGEAIVDGALYLGLDPTIITSRRMRMTYGCAAIKLFDPSIHDPRKKQRIGSIDYCKDVFDKYVTNGEEVEINQGVIRTYKVTKANQKTMKIAVYGTKVARMDYVDHPASKKIGDIIVDLSDTGGIYRKVKVVMYFGKSEIKLHATEEATGKEYKATIKYQGDTFESTDSYEDEESRNHHIIFANDISGSMTRRQVTPTLPFLKTSHDNCLGALYESCFSFLEKRSASCPSDIVSCIVHHHDSIINFEKRAISSRLVQDEMTKYTATGDNNFLKVMQTIEAILSRSDNSSYTPIAIFMTDGIWHDDGAAAKLEQVMAQYGPTGFTLHVVALGNSINRELMERFARIGKGSFTVSSFDLSQLKETYEHLAGLLE